MNGRNQVRVRTHYAPTWHNLQIKVGQQIFRHTWETWRETEQRWREERRGDKGKREERRGERREVTRAKERRGEEREEIRAWCNLEWLIQRELLLPQHAREDKEDKDKERYLEKRRKGKRRQVNSSMHRRTFWFCSSVSSNQSDQQIDCDFSSSRLCGYLSDERTDWNVNHSDNNMTNRQVLWVMLHAEMQKSQMETFLIQKESKQTADKFVPESISLSLSCPTSEDIDSRMRTLDLWNTLSLNL